MRGGGVDSGDEFARGEGQLGMGGADLRRRGRPMQVIDIMLAAIALSLGILRGEVIRQRFARDSGAEC